MIGTVLSPELLRADWRAKSEGEHHTHGHCYVAAEAMFHLLGGHGSELSPRYAKYLEDDEWCTHWWLYSSNRARIFDPSKEQYTYVELNPPYHLGKRCAFLTKQPSKRAVIVIDRVKAKFDEKELTKLVETFKVEQPVFDKLFDV
jgi:hypothetical protein